MKTYAFAAVLIAASLLIGFRVGRVAAEGEARAVYGATNPTPEQRSKMKPRYCAGVVGLLAEKEQQYRELHAAVWPEVTQAIRKANIRNFNIYAATMDGKRYLFYQFEYVGEDFAKDMASMGNDPTTKNKWWPITDACQRRLPGTPDGSQWLEPEMVMHMD